MHAFQVLPTPQYAESFGRSVSVASGTAICIATGPLSPAASPKLRLAADWLRRELLRVDASLAVSVVDGQASTGRDRSVGNIIHVWDYSADQAPPVALSALDHEILSNKAHFGQSYVIRTNLDAHSGGTGSIWAIGATDQGAFMGAMTLLQLIRRRGTGVEVGVDIDACNVRDYPDFEFRVASDWLLNVEINRWALDRGQGIEAFARLCESKLDRAASLKINAVLFDGFGWGLDERRFVGYAALMRRLNRHARARGISLIFGGYGASYGIAYQPGPLYEEGAYLGRVFENREWYPDGTAYPCIRYRRNRKGVDSSLLGSCRSNEDLNRLKADDLRRFVEAVEPGGLYIHHEDFGGFEATRQAWQGRCPRCRARWPDDTLEALTGGAGALAHGYSALVQAVNDVRNPDSGYEARRDCQVILISPVYEPDSASADDWRRVLDLWTNVGLLLPRAGNLQAGFREVFPRKPEGTRWTEEFNRAMRSVGLGIGAFILALGGADSFLTDYPLTGTPAMNAQFRGAQSLCNGTGDSFREPMEVIAAEYSWNTASAGFFSAPVSHDEAVQTWRRYICRPDEPRQVFGAGGLYEAACELLYGPTAGPIMASYYRESDWLPDVDLPGVDSETGDGPAQQGYLPMTWNRADALPLHWRHLALDTKAWSLEIGNETYAREVARMGIDRRELHRRMAHRWHIVAALNARGADHIALALAAEPRPQAIDDLLFLQTSFRVYQPVLEALTEFHRGLEQYFTSPEAKTEARDYWRAALAKASQARDVAAQAFPQPIDPVGGEVGALRQHSERLAYSIESWLAQDT